MNTKITTIALLLGASLCAWGNHVTPERALSIANEFVANGSHRAPSTATNTFTLSHTAINTVDQATDFYVFNREGGNGFVIVAGDDAGTPVLAYSDHGNMDMDNLPCNVQYWLEQYQQQELQLRQHPELARQPKTLSTSVEPLLTTKWNQYEPYNNLCPTVDGEATYTGCGATALAQIMKYHNWPNKGIGSESYEWEKGGVDLSMDFSQSTYQWDKMLDEYDYDWEKVNDEWIKVPDYTDEQANAVATLMRDAGYAMHMNYGLDGSGANVPNFIKAMYFHFDYDIEVQCLFRDFYNPESWDGILRKELVNSRPILYVGYSENSGHYFIFDGYDSNGYFHVNWGWGGYEDGYFLSSATDDYIYNQEAVIGIQPNTGSGVSAPLVGYCWEFYPLQDYLQVNLGSYAHIFLKYSMTTLSLWDTLHMGILIQNESESMIVSDDDIWDETNSRDMTDYQWWWFGEDGDYLYLPSNLANGRYHLKLVFSTDNKATYQNFLYPIGHPGYILMEVKDGVAYFSLEEYRRGDVDNSGSLDGIDLNILINIILGKDNADNYGGRADLDSSGSCDGNDLNQLINLLLGK